MLTNTVSPRQAMAELLFKNRSSRLVRLIYTGLAVIFTFIPLWHFYNFPSSATYFMGGSNGDHFLNDTAAAHTNPAEQHFIPNLAHFVYVLQDPSNELVFHFSDLLSMYAAHHYWQPDAIYLHTNAPQEAIDRARDGRSGKWSKLLFDIPGLQVRNASVPTHARNGKEIKLIEHKTDFVRVQAVREFGGAYIDFDVHPLRDIRVLRESGFNAIGLRQLGGEVCAGVFMSKKRSKLINRWAEEMHQVYDGGWTTHANGVVTRVGEQLVAEPREMLIMEREAFAPGSWEANDAIKLFEVHNETASNLENIDSEGRLPSFEGNSTELSPPKWATKWSRTYLLHAFKPERSKTSVNGFDHITPRYVLERRSNFARAVYPIAKLLHDRGLLEIDDSY